MTGILIFDFRIMTDDNVDNSTIADARFDDSRPQFRNIRTADESKVILDERFASALTDPRFQLPGKKKQREKLSEFYAIAEDANKSPSKKYDDKKEIVNTTSGETKTSKHKMEKKKTKNDDAQQQKSESRISYLMALARGKVDVSSSSDEDDDDPEHDDTSSEDDDDSEATQDEAVGILNANSEDLPMTETPSPYLAIQNLDWSNVRAVDIFMIISSFVPNPGAVRRVRVFPSDFGLEKMEKEELMGPTNIWKRKRRKIDEDEDIADDEVTNDPQVNTTTSEFVESDFDPEKLRAYEVSKLKYYFAIVEFSDPKYADLAYEQVDGMEFESSSAALDMRSIEIDQIDDIVKDRPLRDESTGVPSHYEPPDFVVDALQQSNVDCTWDVGDRDRARVLTKYLSGDTWKELAEDGQLKQYLASDVSSAESSDEEGEKAQSMRKLLGLEEDDQDGDEVADDDDGDDTKQPASADKEFKFVPKATNSDDDEQEDDDDSHDSREKPELSPWEAYKEKRKQKKREKRQAARERKKQFNEQRKGKTSVSTTDPFFQKSADEDVAFTQPLATTDLELLAAEDGNGESGRDDYDMRALQRAEKNKHKKLKGKRKKKEERVIEPAAGDTFQVDTNDDRFRAVLDGTDARFGIDPTDPNFKVTSGMQTIMKEQTRRRKERKRRIPDVDNGEQEPSPTESKELQSLVENLKKKTKK